MLLMIVLVLTIISLGLGILWPYISVRLFTGLDIGHITILQHATAYLFLIPKILVCLCVAIWLGGLAGKYGASRTGWFVLGLFLGVIALVVFYVVRVHDMIEAQISNRAAVG
jgi:hypothetical protein